MDERSKKAWRQRLRLVSLYALLAFLLVFARPTVASVAAGIGLVAVGEAVRFWAAGHLFKTQELITSGPYRFTRNPLYLGRLLIFTGLAIMANLPYYGSAIALVVGWALFFGNYMRRKERVEPARLREIHGAAYDRYFAAVPALFPTLRPYPDPSGGRWSGHRMARNKEYWMLVGLALVAAFLAWRASAEPPVPQAVLDRIQRHCLRAYPDEMLAEMASGARQVPPPVEEDPKAQMQFLDHESPRDKGLFYPSLLEELLPAFERYLAPGSRFLDLGSGDGRAVFLAAVLGAHATGIEYDETLVEVSRKAREALADLVDPERARIVHGDFFAEPWSGYDVIYYFDQGSFAQDRVREKLRRELDPGAVLLVGHEQAPFPGLEVETVFPDTEVTFPDVKVYRRGAAPPPGGSRR